MHLSSFAYSFVFLEHFFLSFFLSSLVYIARTLDSFFFHSQRNKCASYAYTKLLIAAAAAVVALLVLLVLLIRLVLLARLVLLILLARRRVRARSAWGWNCSSWRRNRSWRWDAAWRRNYDRYGTWWRDSAWWRISAWRGLLEEEIGFSFRWRARS